MPFESEAQRRWMYANDPEMAKRWQQHTPKGVKLPVRKQKRKKPAMKSLPANLQDVSVEKAAELLAMQKQANILRSIGDSTALRGAAKSLAGIVRAVPGKTQELASHYSDPANWSTGGAALGGAALGALGGAGSSMLDQKKRKHLLSNTLAGALAGGAVGGGAKMVADSDWLSKALSSAKAPPMGGVTDPNAAAGGEKAIMQQAAQKLTPEKVQEIQQNVEAATSNKPELMRGAMTAGTVAAGTIGSGYAGKKLFNTWNKARPDFDEIAARSLPQPSLPGAAQSSVAAPKLSPKDTNLAFWAKMNDEVPTAAPKLQPGVLNPAIKTTAKDLAQAYKQNPGAAIGAMKNTVKGELPMITPAQRIWRNMRPRTKMTGGAAGLAALLFGGYHAQNAIRDYVANMYKERSDAAARLAKLTAEAGLQNQ